MKDRKYRNIMGIPTSLRISTTVTGETEIRSFEEGASGCVRWIPLPSEVSSPCEKCGSTVSVTQFVDQEPLCKSCRNLIRGMIDEIDKLEGDISDAKYQIDELQDEIDTYENRIKECRKELQKYGFDI